MAILICDSFSEINKEFWTGGTNLGSEPQFYWMAYEKPVTFTDWLEGEPNNAGGHENCIQIWTPKNFKWNDESCYTKCNFVCEEDGSEWDI